LDVHCYGETEPHVHARGVGPNGNVLELLQLCEVDDLLEVLVDVTAREPVDRRIEIHVLDARELGMKAGSDLDQRANAAGDREPAGAGREDPGDQLQQSRLAGAVSTDDPKGLSTLDVEVDVLERPELPRSWQLASKDRFLERTALREPDLEHSPEPARANLA